MVQTLSSTIASPEAFRTDPAVWAYGMLCALCATALWLAVAMYAELPVSTTHAIVGAVIGMTMVAAGPNAVLWSFSSGEFPFFGVRCVCRV